MAPLLAHYKYVDVMALEDERDRQFELLHERYAPVCLDLCVELGGFFIKFGQVLSVRPEVIPQTYRTAFRTMRVVFSQKLRIMACWLHRNTAGRSPNGHRY